MEMKCYKCFKDYDRKYEICPHCGHIPNTVKREANHLSPGTVLNERYYLGEVCGFGGFGITYRAWDLKLETVVAIKEYFPNGLVNRIPGTENLVMFSGNKLKEYNYGLARFIEEARTVAKFSSHNNIVNVFEYFEANRTAYIVMEFLDGIALDKFLRQEGQEKLDVDTAIDITLNICNALKAIHKENIVHRDVSPDNIYLCMNGAIKLFDFGASRFSKEDTQLMTIIVKPGYAPTEQYESTSPQGAWTDVYALGATLYHMVTGIKPIESTNRKTKDDLLEPDQIDQCIPKYVNDAIMRAMAIEPHMRFQTIDEFEAVLKKDKPVVSLAQERKRRRNKLRMGITAAGLAVAVGLIVFSVNWFRQKEANTLAPAEITIWFNSNDAGAEQALAAIKEEFCENYEGITIHLTGISIADYQKELDKAISNGTMPTLFQSDCINVAATDVLSLKPLIKKIDTEDYCFLKDYTDYYPAYEAIPLGFQIPILYINTTRCTSTYDTFNDIADVVSVNGSLAIDVNARAAYDQLFGNSSVTSNAVTEQFYGNSADALFSDSSKYHVVRSALPARYKMLAVNAEPYQFSFDNCWSMGKNSSSDEVKAAQRFLTFMLSDNAQDYYYIRNQYAALPINKNALEVYADVYAEFQPLIGELVTNDEESGEDNE